MPSLAVIVRFSRPAESNSKILTRWKAKLALIAPTLTEAVSERLGDDSFNHAPVRPVLTLPSKRTFSKVCCLLVYGAM